MTSKCVVCGEPLTVTSRWDDEKEENVEVFLHCELCGLQYAKRPEPQAPRQS